MPITFYNNKVFGLYVYGFEVKISDGGITTWIDLIETPETTFLMPELGSTQTITYGIIRITGSVVENGQEKGTVVIDLNEKTGVTWTSMRFRSFRNPINIPDTFVNPISIRTVKIQQNISLQDTDLRASYMAPIDYKGGGYGGEERIYVRKPIPTDLNNFTLDIDGFKLLSSIQLFETAIFLTNKTQFVGKLSSGSQQGILAFRGDKNTTSNISTTTLSIEQPKTQSITSNTSSTSTTSVSVSSSPPPVEVVKPTVTIPVYPVKYFGCYVSNFDGYLTTNGDGKLNIYLYEDPSAGLTFQAPIINSDFTFIFDGMVFKGVITKYQELTNSITPDIKKYFVEVACYEGISNFSDQIFNNDVITFNFSVAPSNIRLDTNSSDINIIAYLNTASNPSTEYGSHFSWNSSSAKYFSIGDIQYTGSKPYESLYQITGNKSIYLTQTVVKSATSTPSNPASTGGTLSTTSSNGTSVTSSTNAFGAGTTTTTAPNSTNEPIGETTTYVTTGGFTTQTTRTVTATEVIVTTNSTFNAIPNNSQFAANQRKSANIPANFQGSVDPISMYPSMEIYPSGSYAGEESGRYFGNSASPTSFDLDPYFYFTTNDFNLVAKDSKSNTKNVNVKKDSIKNHVRTMGLKGPMLLSGWGYDVRGLPVPNSSGLIPSGEYQFHPKTSTQRRFWKTGPVDLRWHGKKKTWVGGQEMLEGYLLSDLDAPDNNTSSTTAKMSVLRVATPSGLTGQKLLTQSSGILRDDKGNQTGVRPAIYDHEYITITNRDPSLSASSGTYCIALDINYEWRPIYIGC